MSQVLIRRGSWLCSFGRQLARSARLAQNFCNHRTKFCPSMPHALDAPIFPPAIGYSVRDPPPTALPTVHLHRPGLHDPRHHPSPSGKRVVIIVSVEIEHALWRDFCPLFKKVWVRMLTKNALARLSSSPSPHLSTHH